MSLEKELQALIKGKQLLGCADLVVLSGSVLNPRHKV
jgi:precorrin-4 methylase